MSLIDDLLRRGGFGGVPPAAGMLNLNPTDDQDLIVDPTTGAAVRSGVPRAGVFEKPKLPGALSMLRAGAGLTAPTAPYSGGYGADIPFSPPVPADADLPANPPMPQPRPAMADAGPPLSLAAPAAGDSALPSRSAPAEGATPAAEPGILDKLTSALGNNSSTLIALGAGLAGAPNAGQGISRALSAALPAQQADLKRSMMLGGQKSTFNALVEAGVPRQQAMAALQNPKLLEQLTSRYLVDPKHELKTTTDMLGNQHLIAVDPYTLKSRELTGNDAEDGGATPGGPGNNPATLRTSLNAAAAMPQSYDPETHRDEGFLSSLDPLTSSAVKDIADGKMPATGRNMQKLMPLVSRYENGFDNTTYQRRQALEKSYYGGGEGAKALRSANTTIDHGIQLKKAIEDLHNFSILPDVLNPITGKIAEQYSKPYQDALKRFTTNSELYSKELDFALTGKTTVSGTNHIRELFDKNASPVSNQASLQKTLEMLEQRVNEHENTYNTGMNKKGGAPIDMLSKRKELRQLLGADTGAGVNAEGPISQTPSQRRTSTGVPWSIVPQVGAP